MFRLLIKYLQAGETDKHMQQVRTFLCSSPLSSPWWILFWYHPQNYQIAKVTEIKLRKNETSILLTSPTAPSLGHSDETKSPVTNFPLARLTWPGAEWGAHEHRGDLDVGPPQVEPRAMAALADTSPAPLWGTWSQRTQLSHTWFLTWDTVRQSMLFKALHFGIICDAAIQKDKTWLLTSLSQIVNYHCDASQFCVTLYKSIYVFKK